MSTDFDHSNHHHHAARHYRNSTTKQVKFSNDVLNVTSSTMNDSSFLNTSGDVSTSDVFDPFASTDDEFVAATDVMMNNDVFPNSSTSPKRGDISNNNQQHSGAHFENDDNDDPPLQMPYMSDDDDLSSDAEKRIMVRRTSPNRGTTTRKVFTFDQSSAEKVKSSISPSPTSPKRRSPAASADWKQSGLVAATRSPRSNPRSSPRSSPRVKSSSERYHPSPQKQLVRPRSSAHQRRSVSTTSSSSRSQSREERHAISPTESYRQQNSVLSEDEKNSRSETEDEDWKKAEEEWELASQASSVTTNQSSLKLNTSSSTRAPSDFSANRQLSPIRHYESSDAESLQEQDNTLSQRQAVITSPSSTYQEFASTGSVGSTVSSASSRSSHRNSRARRARGSKSSSRKGRSLPGSPMYHQSSSSSAAFIGEVLDEDDEDSIFVSTDDDSQQQMNSKNATDRFVSNTEDSSPGSSKSSSKNLMSSLSPHIKKDRLANTNGNDDNDSIRDPYYGNNDLGATALSPSPHASAVTLNKTLPVTTSSVLSPSNTNTTNQGGPRVSFAQHMNKVQYFDVPSVASTATSNNYGKYHSDDDDTDEDTNDSDTDGTTETEDTDDDGSLSLTENNSTANDDVSSNNMMPNMDNYCIGGNATGDLSRSFISKTIGDEVGDVLKDLFLVGTSNAPGQIGNSPRNTSIKHQHQQWRNFRNKQKSMAKKESGAKAATASKSCKNNDDSSRPPSQLLVPMKINAKKDGRSSKNKFSDQDSTEDEEEDAVAAQTRRPPSNRKSDQSFPEDESSSDSSTVDKERQQRANISISQSNLSIKPAAGIFPLLPFNDDDDDDDDDSDGYSDDNDTKTDVSSIGFNSFRGHDPVLTRMMQTNSTLLTHQPRDTVMTTHQTQAHEKLRAMASQMQSDNVTTENSISDQQSESTANNSDTLLTGGIAQTVMALPIQQFDKWMRYVENGVDMMGTACGLDPPPPHLRHNPNYGDEEQSNNNKTYNEEDDIDSSKYSQQVSTNDANIITNLPLPQTAAVAQENEDNTQQNDDGTTSLSVEGDGTYGDTTTTSAMNSTSITSTYASSINRGNETILQQYMRYASDILFPPKLENGRGSDHFRLGGGDTSTASGTKGGSSATSNIRQLHELDEAITTSEQAPKTQKEREAEAEAGLMELALCAARASHAEVGLVYDEETDIDVVNEISFMVLTLPLPLGLLFQQNTGGCYISRVFRNGNAALNSRDDGGVRVGDQLAAVNGKSVAMLSVTQVTSMVNRSPDPSEVELTFIRYTGSPRVKGGNPEGVSRIVLPYHGVHRTPSTISRASAASSSGVDGKHTKVRWNLGMHHLSNSSVKSNSNNSDTDCKSDTSSKRSSLSGGTSTNLSPSRKKGWKMFNKTTKKSNSSSDLGCDAASDRKSISSNSTSSSRKSLFSTKHNISTKSSNTSLPLKLSTKQQPHEKSRNIQNDVKVIHGDYVDGDEYSTDDGEDESTEGDDQSTSSPRQKQPQKSQSVSSLVADTDTSSKAGDVRDGKKKKFRLFGRSKKGGKTKS